VYADCVLNSKFKDYLVELEPEYNGLCLKLDVRPWCFHNELILIFCSPIIQLLTAIVLLRITFFLSVVGN